jgi:hypothetical protein
MGMIYQGVSPGSKTAEYIFELTASQKLATVHQVSIEPSASATGTVAVYVRANGRTTYEPVTENGVAVVVDVADSRAVRIFGAVDAIKLTPTGISGGETFTPTFSGWEG